MRPRCKARLFDPGDTEGLGCGFRCDLGEGHSGDHWTELSWTEAEAVYRPACDDEDG